MTIHFGIDLNDRIYPQISTEIGVLYCGAQGLLLFLEQKCGILPPLGDTSHLRIEQYRQALSRYLEKNPNCFYANSFAADAFGTAEALLERRDILPRINFENNENLNKLKENGLERLNQLFEIDELIENDPLLSLHKGFADRLRDVAEHLPNIIIDIEKIVFNEPFELLPFELQTIFDLIFKYNPKILKQDNNALKPTILAEKNTKLGIFQRKLLRETDLENTKNYLENIRNDDDSLLIIEADRETDAADFLANIFKNNTKFKPLLLIPERNRALDNTFLQEGLPTLGIESASLARPTLQLLKLASTFLWQPIDPFKIMEFLTLPVKPLRDDLAIQLAALMAEAPGINSDKWYAKVERYFEELPEKLDTESSLTGKTAQDRFTTARKQYDFWFNRRRIALNRRVPKQDALDIYIELRRWAVDTFKENSGTQSSLLVLAEQARRIVELLEALPERERDLSFLQLEQLVRTVYASSPISLDATQIGSLPFVYCESCVLKSVKNTIWWNFCSRQNDHYFNKWYKAEIEFLQTIGTEIDSPKKQAALRQWQRNRPILLCSEQLILIVPKKIDGETMLEHALMGELKANFPNYHNFTFNINKKEDFEALKFKLSPNMPLENAILAAPPAHIQVSSPKRLLNTTETEQLYYSSLSSLLRYPHNFVFKQKLFLRSSAILTIANDERLKGNLAHRIFEQVLEIEQTITTHDELTTWFRGRIFTVMSQEGAVLMMYGREPDRQQFEEQLRRAVWAFLRAIRENNWTVVGVETEVKGIFCEVAAAGRCDVLLRNDKNEFCIIDLKWGGDKKRAEMIKNGKDLQLVLYSKLLMQQEGKPENWAFTAFFIIGKGQFIARNTLAFKEAITPSNIETNHEIANNDTYKKMENTFYWRMKQLAEGKIEVRTKENILALSEIYEDDYEEIFACLELPTESDEYDDFKTLVRPYR